LNDNHKMYVDLMLNVKRANMIVGQKVVGRKKG